MSILINAAISILAFAGTEGLAWFSHKYIMHGFLWKLHREHHEGEGNGILEKNDFFFFFLVTPGILCLAVGAYLDLLQLISVGVGITAYAIAYFFIHEVYIHRRMKWFGKKGHWYFMAVLKAHERHHESQSRNGASCFGMLLVPGLFSGGMKGRKNKA